jgi:hypothetical protein
MSVSAIVRVSQYGAPDGENIMVSLPGGYSSIYNMYNENMSVDSRYPMYFLPAIRNPVPSSSNSKQHPPYYTEEPMHWSDSPVLAPSLNDKYRYAYGRFGATRYGKQDTYVGVMVTSTNFGVSNSVLTEEGLYEGYGKVRGGKVTNISSSLQIEEPERTYGDVTVYQYDFIMSASPSPFSYRNPVDSNISIRLSNYTYPLDETTVSLKLNGQDKVPLEVIPFHTGVGGFDAKWYNDTEFGYGETVYVEWKVRDTASPANELIFYYWFITVKDIIGPRVSLISPADDDQGVSVSSCILFTLRDYEEGININTLELYVNNRLISLSSLVYTEVDTQDGYSITYCPTEDFLFGDEIPVSIYVEDMAEVPNLLFYVYSFNTEESKEPVVVGHIPVSCKTTVCTTQDVEVLVVDGGSGLNKESITLIVDDVSVSARKLPIIYREG